MNRATVHKACLRTRPFGVGHLVYEGSLSSSWVFCHVAYPALGTCFYYQAEKRSTRGGSWWHGPVAIYRIYGACRPPSPPAHSDRSRGVVKKIPRPR